MKPNNSSQDIKNKIINNSLLFGFTVGFLIFIIRVIFTSDNNTNFRLFIDLSSITALLTIWYFRNKISLTFKTLVIITTLFFIWSTGLYSYGYLSHNTLLFICMPLFLVLSVSNRMSIFFTILFVIVYLALAYAYTTGFLSIDGNPIDRITNVYHWIIQLLFLVIISFVIVVIINAYKAYFNKLVTKLEIQNIELNKHQKHLSRLVEERTEKLNQANDKLKSTNIELESKNELIINQNSELKTTLQNLTETQAQLLQAEKMASLGILTAGVAHEINNPLNYIMGAYVGLNDYFEEHGSAEEDKTNILLKGINTGIERVANIVSGLNHFSRDNSNFDEDCAIHSILDNCLVILRSQIKHKADLHRNYYQKEIIIKGNVGKLHQVFLNVLTNALDAINENGKIVIITKVDNKDISIGITDNGIGIKSEDIQKVTDPFFTTKSPGEGTGLGLSVSYSIIQSHRGTLEIESEFEKGTRVMIKLPKQN